MEAIRNLNKSLREIFANASAFVNAVDISDIDKNIRDIICSRLPAILNQILGSNSVNYKIKGSVGAGKATKTPWIAIMDKEITETTRKGVYMVFLFSSDYKHVYLTLNQGTTVPGQFGPRLSEREIRKNTQSIRECLQEDNDFLKNDNNAESQIKDIEQELFIIHYGI